MVVCNVREGWPSRLVVEIYSNGQRPMGEIFGESKNGPRVMLITFLPANESGHDETG